MKSLRTILPFIGAGAILTIIFSAVDLGPIFDLAHSAEYPLMIAALLVLFFAHIFTILRWQNVLLLMGYDLNISVVARAYLANLPITKITPAFSGDFVRSVFIKERVPISVGSGGIFLEALLDISILLISILAGAFWTGALVPALIAIALMTGMIFAAYILNTEWVRGKLEKYVLLQNFVIAIQLAYKNPTRTLKLILLTAFAWMGTVIFLWLTFAALRVDVSLASIIFLQPLAVFAGLLPITVSGVGVRESAMFVLYSGVAGAPAVLFVGLAYSFATTIVFPLICLPITLQTFRKLVRQAEHGSPIA